MLGPLGREGQKERERMGEEEEKGRLGHGGKGRRKEKGRLGHGCGPVLKFFFFTLS